jgi:DNA ligase (NAD+)
MNSKELKKLEEEYLKYKYEYYILGNPSISDFTFDRKEEYLKSLGSKIVDLVDFPTIKEIEELGLNPLNIVSFDKIDNTQYKHHSLMLSLQKIQVNDEINMPISDVNLFFNRNNSEYIEYTSKYDGNSMELIYEYRKLNQVLTRGTKTHGFDKTNKIKHIVPNEIDMNGLIEIRGEIVINTKLWEKKYSNPNKVDNPRNYVAGVLRNEKYSLSEIKDLTFVAYSLAKIENGKKIYIENSMEILKKLGFNQNYDPLIIKSSKNIEEFRKNYFIFKKYRETCPFLLDGFVLKYPENKRNIIGENSHDPKWAIAIKFLAEEVQTTILDIEWTLGKDGHLTPIAILEPVELLGTIVTKATLSNLGTIIKKKTFPGAVVSLKKSGEIIPMIVDIIIESPDIDKYMEDINELLRDIK